MRRTGTLCATFVLIGLGSAAPAQAAAPPECGSWPATIVGTEGPDVITGTPGFDVIVGLGGNDSVSGAIGGDFVCGGSGDDEIISPRGLVAYGDEGNDRIEVGEGDLTDVARIHGGPGNDVLVNRGLVQTSADGGSGDDRLVGGPGRDNFEPGPGIDVVDGGDGDNTVYYASSAVPVTVNLTSGIAMGQGRDTLTGIDNITGSLFDDRLIGDDRGNIFNGFTGLDYIAGRGGNDDLGGYGTLLGGDGDDLIQDICCDPPATDDVIDGGAGIDTLALDWSESGVTLDLTLGTASGTATGEDTVAGIEIVMGTTFGDILIGDGLGNRLEGRGGPDRLEGRGAADKLYGGSGTDTILGQNGDDFLAGGPGTDNLDGGAGQDTCTAGEITVGCES